MNMQGKFDFVKWGSIATPAVFLGIMFVLPMTALWVFSFSEKSGIVDMTFTGTLDNYARIFDPLYINIFVKTIGITTISTIICFVVAFILALCIVFARSETTQTIMLFLVMLPFWINMLIRAYALIVVLRTKGVINQSLKWVWQQSTEVVETLHLTHFGLLNAKWVPFELLYNNTAVVIGLVYVHLPFMVLPIYGSLNKIDKSCLEASYDLGAGHFRTMTQVVIPMIKFGVISGFVVTFIPMLGSFLIPDLLGGKDSIMIANVIAEQFKAANDWPFGSAMAFFLIYITFFVIAYKAYLEGRVKGAV